MARRSEIVLGFFLVLCGVVIYLPALNGGAVFDDVGFFSSNYIANYGDLLSGDLGRRWVAYGSFAFQSLVFGEDFYQFHWVNLLVHIACAGEVVALIKILCVREKDGQMLAWGGGFMFVVHPVSVYGAAYLVQRSILMATLFSLASLILFLVASAEEKRARSIWIYLCSLVLFYLALCSKEHVIMVPAVAMVLAYQVGGGKLVKKSIPWLAVTAGMCFLVILGQKGILGVPYENWVSQGYVESSGREIFGVEHLYAVGALHQSKLFFYYMGLVVFPHPSLMSVDMRLAFPTGLSAGLFLWGFGYLVWGGVGGSILLKYRGKIGGVVGAAILYPWLLFWTEFSSVRIVESFVLYRAYLWLPLFLFIPVVAVRLFFYGREKLGVVCFFSLIGFLGLGAYNRSATFSSDLAVWNDAVRWVEENADKDAVFNDRVYYNRGVAKMLKGDGEGAKSDFYRAIELNANGPMAYFGLGRVLQKERRYFESEDAFSRVIEISPDFLPALRGRAEVRASHGDFSGQEEDLKHACDLKDPIACFLLEKKEGRNKGFIYQFAK